LKFLVTNPDAYIGRTEVQDEELSKWLASSYWKTESYLEEYTRQRTVDSLRWATSMPEFHRWRTSSPGSSNRVLWLTGLPGSGKSILSAYLVNILQSLYREAQILYFFCRAGVGGVDTVLDVVRTLSQQALINDSVAHSLRSLKRQGFSVDIQLGISMLVKRLLLNPLARSDAPVFVILDGLDELNSSALDPVSDESQIQTFISSLADASNVSCLRLLLVSRPECNFGTVISDIPKKIIREYETREDIHKYVAEQLCGKPILLQAFEVVELDPKGYFVNNAKGIFLWAKLAIKELEAASAESVFRRRLRDLCEASGSMDKLYFSLLSRITQPESS
jgi:hypothetical protein